MAMENSAVLPVAHAEWIKIKSLRSSLISLLVIFAATLAITVLASATIGRAEADNPDAEPLFDAFYAFNFGQIAAISFGTTAMSSEYTSGALRISLAAVPRRGLFYGSKMLVIGSLALLVGLVTGFATFLTSQAFLGDHAIGLGHPGAVRACVGGGVYLALMALLAAGLTAVLRSGVAVLGILIPFTLIVSFVVGDVAGGAAGYLPDKAGRQVLHETTTGSLGPWAGLAVCAAWTGGVLLAGWWAVRHRDA
ncbi:MULTISPECIES: ABC transporter permease [Streptomyces]|uniref:ABC transporter permease n=1 Tax=Streptomyces venezuelae TaxID=54571 RepID=A0A5P2B5Z3_STRVZ|nr:MULTISPECIES: ABC transporter permease [Streptomyces]NEA04513.1 ABC transporter permease subunit [Streptomyces sp. SID10116]MYY81807.1 ABC transporter permease subunit [Streptomyces sp. SID335]MYZ12219.1 ABC transporter permease subunit [Streptomyces sp. SID337]NDZ89864.1 ABC transporter permease subunit [Streptomyces sp. SID10115]NEB44124.1 ABC transporter permease subunit [Streptomyces sp. SID339]